MKTHREVSIDPVLRECLRESGMPAFAFQAIVDEGKVDEVYARLNERLNGRPLTTQDFLVVEQVLHDVIQNDPRIAVEVAAVAPPVTSASLFPAPLLLDDDLDRIAVGGPQEPESTTALNHLRSLTALNRLRSLMDRYRVGEMSAERALEKISETLESLPK